MVKVICFSSSRKTPIHILVSHDINNQFPVNGKHVPAFRTIGKNTMQALREEFPAYMNIVTGQAEEEDIEIAVKFTTNDLKCDVKNIPLPPPREPKDHVLKKRDKIRAFLNAHYSMIFYFLGLHEIKVYPSYGVGRII